MAAHFGNMKTLICSMYIPSVPLWHIWRFSKIESSSEEDVEVPNELPLFKLTVLEAITSNVLSSL